MSLKRPTTQKIDRLAKDLGLTLSSNDVESFLGLIDAEMTAYDQLDAMPDEIPALAREQSPGHRPDPQSNPLNAWYQRTAIKGAASGILHGKTVVLKDNIMLAGVPMMNGAATLEGYIPELDATVVTRVLDAGGEIVGKAHCEFLCLSAGSHTNSTGPVRNPHRPSYSAGGSSSGCAALIAAGEVDMAIGGDQGGSIRTPSSFCGIYGMKPTHGLVPYTGIMPIEVVIDHAGPMTANVYDNALLLEAIAGPDGFDPRQSGAKTQPYRKALTGDIRDLRIAVVAEGFGHSNSEAEVDACVRSGAAILERLGANVQNIAIPEHAAASAITAPIGIEGLTHTLMLGDGYGTGRSDLYVTSLMDAHRGWRRRADELSETAKLYLLLGAYVYDRYGSRYYAKAANLSRKLRAAYDRALETNDLLLMPTLPIRATPLPEPDADRELQIRRASEMVRNTAPFNVSHHPAMSIPCGMRDGLPMGMMLIGRHFDEPTIYRAAHAFEQSVDWTKRG